MIIHFEIFAAAGTILAKTCKDVLRPTHQSLCGESGQTSDFGKSKMFYLSPQKRKTACYKTDLKVA